MSNSALPTRLTAPRPAPACPQPRCSRSAAGQQHSRRPLRQGRALPAASAAASSVAAAPAAPVVEALDSKPGVFTVQGRLASAVPEETVWRILTDYQALPKVYRTVRESWAETNGTETTVVQVCTWAFLMFSGSFETRLKVHDARDQSLLVFTLAESSFMRNFEGRWQVEGDPQGGCRIRHTLSVEPTLKPPGLFRDYTQRIFVKQVTGLLEDLSAELQRHV